MYLSKLPPSPSILLFNQYAGHICFGGVGNVVNVLARKPHNHKYANQESLWCLMLTPWNVCVTQTNAEGYIKSASCIFWVSRVFNSRETTCIEHRDPVLVCLICRSQYTADRPFGVALCSIQRNKVQDKVFEVHGSGFRPKKVGNHDWLQESLTNH